METQECYAHKITKTKLTKTLREWLLSCGGREERKCHLEKLRRRLLELGNEDTMKKAIFQLSMRCEVSLEKLTQEDIDKHTKRNIYKRDEKIKEHRVGKRKHSSVGNTHSKKQKVITCPAQSSCGPELVCVGHSNGVDNDRVPQHGHYLYPTKASSISSSCDRQELQTVHNAPSYVSEFQNNGADISRGTTGNDFLGFGTQEPKQIEGSNSPGSNIPPWNGTAVPSSCEIGGASISSPHEIFKKKGQDPKMFSKKIGGSASGNIPKKETSSSANQVHKTWGRSVSLDIKSSNNHMQQKMVVKEMNNNKVSLKPSSRDNNNLASGVKKPFAVMHTGKLQGHKTRVPSDSAMVHNSSVSRRRSTESRVVNFPPGVTVVRHGAQETHAGKLPAYKDTTAIHSSSAKNSAYGSILPSKEHSVHNDNFRSNPEQKSLSDGVTWHQNKFNGDIFRVDSSLQPLGIYPESVAPVIKTEVDAGNASFLNDTQDNLHVNSYVPELPAALLDMPDISEGTQHLAPSQNPQVWKRSVSESHASGTFVQLMRRHSFDVNSYDHQHFAEHRAHSQKEKSNSRHNYSTQAGQRLITSIERKNSTQVQDVNSTSTVSRNNVAQKDVIASTRGEKHSSKERHMPAQVLQSSSQDTSSNPSNVVCLQNVNSEDNTEREKFRESKKPPDANSSRSKFISRRHSASSSSSHSSMKEKIKDLFGESEEDIAIDDCPSPDKVFRRISSKSLNKIDHTVRDIHNSKTPPECEVEVPKAHIGSEFLASENMTLGEGNLVQLDLSSLNIDKLFPSASDNEGGNSDKIQILPHLDDVSCQTSVKVICSSENQPVVDHTNPMEELSKEIIHNTVQQSPTAMQYENNISDGNLQNLHCETDECMGNVTAEIEHSPGKLNEMNESVTVKEKTELCKSTQRPDTRLACGDDHLDMNVCDEGLNACLLDEVESQLLPVGELCSKDSNMSPTGVIVSSDGIQTSSQILGNLEPSGSAVCSLDKEQFSSQPAFEVSSEECDETSKVSVSSDAKQPLETLKSNTIEEPFNVECSDSCQKSCITITVSGSDSSIDRCSDSLTLQLSGTEVPSENQPSDLSLLVCLDESNTCQNTTEITNLGNNSPLSVLGTGTPTEVQKNVVAMSFTRCENTVVPTVDSGDSVKDMLSNLPLKQEVDCDSNANNMVDVTHAHSLERVMKVAKQSLNECVNEENLLTGMPPVVGVLNGMNCVTNCSPVENVGDSSFEIGAVTGETKTVGIASNNLQVNGVSEINSCVGSAAAQIQPECSVPNDTSDQCNLATTQNAAEVVPVSENPESAATNSGGQQPSSQVGTIRVRDVNSLVEPAAPKVPQSVLNSLVFKEFAALVYIILENKSRFDERLKIARSLPEEYGKIEYESARRDFRTTAYGREIIFTDFVVKNFGSLTTELCVATLGKIESDFGHKYTLKDLDTCLCHLSQLRVEREKMTLQVAQRNKSAGNFTAGNVDDSSQKRVDSTNKASHSQYAPIAPREPVNIANKIHPSYGNYQMVSIQGHQSQLPPAGSAVENTSVTDSTRSDHQSSVLGSLLSQEDSQARKLQDFRNLYLGNGGTQGPAPNRTMGVPLSVKNSLATLRRKANLEPTKTVSGVGQNQAGGNNYKLMGNEIISTRGGLGTYQSSPSVQLTQQHQQSDTSSGGHRRKQDFHHGAVSYSSAADRTSVIRQTAEPSRGLYASSQASVPSADVRKESLSTLQHNQTGSVQQQSVYNRYEPLQAMGSVVSNNHNTQLASQTLHSQTGVSNPSYTNAHQMAFPIVGSSAPTGQSAGADGSMPQSVFLSQMQSTVNHYTASTDAHRKPVGNSIPTQQAYQSAPAQHRLSNKLPTYSESQQLAQVNCTPYLQQYERNASQKLRNIAPAPSVNHLQASNNVYTAGIPRSSQSQLNNPYQAQGGVLSQQHGNTVNNMQVASSNFQQYLGSPAQQLNDSNVQQITNFRQNVVQHSYQQVQAPSQPYSNISVTLSQQAVAAAYQLYSKSSVRQNLAGANHQAGTYGREESAKQAGYGQSASSSGQRAAGQQLATLDLQRLANVNDAQRRAEGAQKHGHRASQSQQRVATAGYGYAQGPREQQRPQVDSLLAAGHLQSLLQPGAPTVALAAVPTSPGFAQPPQLLPPPETAASLSNTGLDDVVLVYEQRANEPRTVSRDSGYTTPSPRVSGNAGTNLPDATDCQETREVVKTEEELKCVLCGETARELCSACRVASYCSKLCQVKDWETSHYKVCNSSSVESDQTSTL